MRSKVTLIIAVGIIALCGIAAQAQTELPKLQPVEIVTSLERLGQPSDAARSLVASPHDPRLVAQVITQYQRLAAMYCGEPRRMYWALYAGDTTTAKIRCQQGSEPLLAALSKGDIALHHVAGGINVRVWRFEKEGTDLRVVQDFRSEPIWGYEFGSYYPAFPR